MQVVQSIVTPQPAPKRIPASRCRSAARMSACGDHTVPESSVIEYLDNHYF